MNERIFPVIVLAIAFLVSLGSLAFVPWNIAPAWEIAPIVFSVLTGFATVLVAYYVYKDYENAEWRADNTRDSVYTLEKLIKLIERLEGIVDDNFDIVTDRLEKLEKPEKEKQPLKLEKTEGKKQSLINPYYSERARELLKSEEAKEKKQP